MPNEEHSATGRAEHECQAACYQAGVAGCATAS